MTLLYLSVERWPIIAVVDGIPRICMYIASLASQPYFSTYTCALGRGAGEGKEKYVW